MLGCRSLCIVTISSVISVIALTQIFAFGTRFTATVTP